MRGYLAELSGSEKILKKVAQRGVKNRPFFSLLYRGGKQSPLIGGGMSK
jgi:hypothetical protein